MKDLEKFFGQEGIKYINYDYDLYFKTIVNTKSTHVDKLRILQKMAEKILEFENMLANARKLHDLAKLKLAEAQLDDR